jgi:N-acetyl-alpha-D-muramate 1-phosphate uridylyltransferase
MKAMLFSAGLGTRFKPWTDHHPKALAIVNGKSLLERNILYLQQYGINEVVVNVHHFAEQIKAAIQKNNGWGSRVHISDESDEVLETGGGLAKAKHLLNDDEFLTLNVDILTDCNLKSFQNYHQSQSALISLAVTNRKSSRRLLFNKYNRLVGWRNNDKGEEKIIIQSKEYFDKAYSGLAIFHPNIFKYMPGKGKFSLIDVYLETGRDNKIAGFDHDGDRFIDVGKPNSIEQAEAMFE